MVPESRFLFLAGDDTALPAIARMLDALCRASFPTGDGERFVWFAAEAEIARAAKSWLRTGRIALPRMIPPPASGEVLAGRPPR